MALTDNLISYWKLDESSGGAIDAHGSNDGTVTGATQGESGKINTSYDFDGNGDYINMGNDASLQFDSSISISAWVYPYGDSLADSAISVVRKGNAEAGTFFLQIVDNNELVQFGYYYSAGNYVLYEHPTATNDNEWIHIVAVFDDSQDELRIYINGNESIGTGFTNSRPSQTASDLMIGRRDTGIRDFYGKIDEVGIWDKALTSSEVEELYNSGDGLSYPFISGAVNPKLKTSGTFATQIIKHKSGGSFSEVSSKVKVGGAFQ